MRGLMETIVAGRGTAGGGVHCRTVRVEGGEPVVGQKVLVSKMMVYENAKDAAAQALDGHTVFLEDILDNIEQFKQMIKNRQGEVRFK